MTVSQGLSVCILMLIYQQLISMQLYLKVDGTMYDVAYFISKYHLDCRRNLEFGTEYIEEPT